MLAAAEGAVDNGVTIHEGGAYVDAEGWARHASGAPISLTDACGVPHKLPPPPTNQHQPRMDLTYSIAPVTSKFSYKFFHFLVEGLPRVALLLDAHPELLTRWPPNSRSASDGLRLLVSCKGRVVRESLTLLGIDRSRVLCWRPGRVYSTKPPATVIWAPPAPCGGAQQSAVRMLRERALLRPWRPLTSARAMYARGHVILHRRDVGTRRLTNHAAVLSAVRAAPSLRGLPMAILNGSGSLASQVGLTLTLTIALTLFLTQFSTDPVLSPPRLA